MSKQPKKLTVAQALKLWLGGARRSELRERTGLSRLAMQKAWMKETGKSWKELSAQHNAHKPKRAAKAGKSRAA